MKMKSIKTRILSIVLVILFLSLGTVSAIFSILSIKNTQDTLYKVMEETAGTAALALENRLLATRSSISEIGTTSRLSNTNVSIEEKNKILDSKKEKYKLLSIDVADKSGKTLNSDSVAGTEGFEAAMDGGTYISSPQVEGSSQVVIVTAPLWKGGLYGTEPVGAIYAKLDAMFLSRMTEKINIGETGTAFMINEAGDTIAHNDPQVVAKQQNFIKEAESDKSLKDLAEMESKALKGEPSYGQYTYKGLTKIGFFVPVEGSRWVMKLLQQI